MMLNTVSNCVSGMCIASTAIIWGAGRHRRRALGICKAEELQARLKHFGYSCGSGCPFDPPIAALNS